MRKSVVGFLMLMCFFAGCAESTGGRVGVEGKVTFKGAPLDTGFVMFVPEAVGGAATQASTMIMVIFKMNWKRSVTRTPHRPPIKVYKPVKGMSISTQISRVISAARFFRSLRRTCRRRCTGAKMIARMVPQNTAP